MLIKLLAVARLRVDQDGSSSSDSSFKSWQRALAEIGAEVDVQLSHRALFSRFPGASSAIKVGSILSEAGRQ